MVSPVWRPAACSWTRASTPPSTALDDYITWFNTTRGHTHCKGLSPVQYRAQTLAA
ncbi:IS3 family transposase [Saccharopolyspora spinosa]|uniref:IS3 family transposase n=1 Tax=Saccharopolyspora spinosa TaxID=60894 RepID=UPI00030DE483|nr:IS3 family transposase [Saccharopolyspora spinosa]